MDNAFNRTQHNTSHSAAAHAEAAQLRCEASNIASRHLKTLASRYSFKHAIDTFIEAQLKRLTQATTESDSRLCHENLKLERYFLREQDIALKTGKAKIHACAELEYYLDGWGYMINGVGIVLRGSQIASGAGPAVTSLTLGKTVNFSSGAVLILKGIHRLSESSGDTFYGSSPEGTKKNDNQSARFMGFSQEAIRITYRAKPRNIAFFGSADNNSKPEARRLFSYLPCDYIRSITASNAPSLLISGTGNAVDIKTLVNDKI